MNSFKQTVFQIVFLMVMALAFGRTTSHAAETRGFKTVIKNDKGQDIGFYSGSYALLIGVSDYTAGWPDLESISSELEEVAVSLKEKGFKVELVLNPDSRQLPKAYEDFIKKYGYDVNNQLLFYFSGHGFTRNNGSKGYLVPADAPNPTENEKEFLQKALNMSRILNWSREMEAKHALFLFDSCFSGTIFKTRALPKAPPHISEVTSKPVRQFITAGSAGEEVPARSVFTPAFVRSLRGEADVNRDGYVTGTELGVYLREKVMSYQTGQTPQYGKIRDPELDEGDFVFILQSGEIPTTVSASTEFSLDDLNSQEKTKWEKYLHEMKQALEQVQLYEQESVSPELKVMAWQRFLEAYDSNHPWSDEDEKWREHGNQQKIRWQQQISNAEISLANEIWTEPQTGMRFVRVEGGPFSEKTWVGQHEVSESQWEKIMGKLPGDSHGAMHPVQVKDLELIHEFIHKLNQSHQLEGPFELIKQKQWEYVCREGGTQTGMSNSANPKKVNFGKNKGMVMPVDSFEPNVLNLYNMQGNVAEWVEEGLLMGGDWMSAPNEVRCDSIKKMSGFFEMLAYDGGGFRLIRTP
ncbi:MAG: caspase family protein [SAR324 cluster bacterium]|nr:caspase family protein [SAR324 cluster bacterium]